MSRLMVAAVASLVVLSACGGGGQAGGSGGDAPVEASSEFAGQGIVLPVPEGWKINQGAVGTGTIVAQPEGEGQRQLLLGAADILGGGAGTAADQSLSDMVDNLRSGINAEPTVDESIDMKGAAEAHQLVYESLEPNPTASPTGATAGPTTQLVILARSSEGEFAIFNYVAPADAYNDSVAQLLRTRGGLDPNSEPTRQPVRPGNPAPTPAPTG